MKAADGKVYVPDALSASRRAHPAGPVSVYMRVVEGARLRVETEADPKNDQEPRYPVRGLLLLELRARPAARAPRRSRAFAAPPGEYDVYVGMRPDRPIPRKGATTRFGSWPFKHGDAARISGTAS